MEGRAGWGSDPTQGSSFIGTTDAHYPHLHPLKAELADMRYHWKAPNPLREAEYIQEHPESLILYEDISFALINLPPGQLPSLLDTLANHLELPLVFGPTTLTQSHTAARARLHLSQHRSYSPRNSFYFWEKWWDPEDTLRIVPEHSLPKIEYFRRVLMAVRSQVPAQHSPTVSQYICFLLCCIYTCSPLQKVLKMRQERCTGLIG